MQILRNWWRSFIEKPIIYFVFIISIVLCVIVSCAFYRMTKNQLQGVNPYRSTYFSINEEFDNAKLFKLVNESNSIKEVKHIMICTERDNSADNSYVGNSISNYVVYIGNAKTIKQTELESQEPVACISIAYAEKYKINIGDSIEISGQPYNVIRKIDTYSLEVYLSGAVLIRFNDDYSMPTPGFIVQSDNGLNDNLLKGMSAIGLKCLGNKPFDPSAIMPIILGIVVLLIACVNIAIAYSYILKRNNQTYIVYKMVGAKNRFVIVSLLFETFLSLVVSFGLAIAIEAPIVKPLLAEFMTELTVFDYLAIFFINLIALSSVLVYRIIKFARCMPADKKYQLK